MNQPQDDPTPPAADRSARADANAAPDAPARALRITVERSGGVAGIAPTWSITATDEPDVDSWLSLVESCPWDAPDGRTLVGGAESGGADGAGGGASGGGGGLPDRFVYTIRVVLAEPSTPEPDDERDARVPERALGPWRTLVDRVKDASTTA